MRSDEKLCQVHLDMRLLRRIFHELSSKSAQYPPFERRYCVSEDIRPRAIGVNHPTWPVDLQVNGEDGYSLPRERLKEYRGKVAHGRPLDFSMRLFETYGYLNVCSFHDRVYWDYNEIFKERKKGLLLRNRYWGGLNLVGGSLRSY